MGDEAPTAPIYDNKSHVRGKLDLSAADWQRAGFPEYAEDGYIEWAFVPHGDGVTYVAMRNSANKTNVLVFTPTEWEAFIAGVRDGEFDER